MKAPSDKHFIHGGIFLLANQLQLAGDQVTRAVSHKQWFVLLALSQLARTASITEVAAEIRSSRQNTAVLLQQLTRKGFVELRSDPQDRRSRLVQLTAAGSLAVKELSGPGNTFVQQLFAGVTAEEIAAGKQLFQKLFDNLDQIKEQKT